MDIPIWIVIAVAGSWIAARIIKLIIDWSTEGKFTFDMLLRDGGMPSAHTSLTVSLATSIFLHEGLTLLFALSAVLAAIVINDAMKSRKVVGELSETVNRLTKGLKDYPLMEERVGHSFKQVAAGAALALVVTIVSYQVFRF